MRVEEYFGPTIMARRALEPQGRWQEFREEYVALVGRFFSDGRTHQEYLVIEGSPAPD